MKKELIMRLAPYQSRVSIITDTFANAFQYLDQMNDPNGAFATKANGTLLDLGFNSVHVDEADRGFSFQMDGPLDMRYDPSQGITAADLVNQLDRDSLTAIFAEYSGETYRTCRHVASVICRRREKQQFTSTIDLATCVNKALEGGKRSRKTPCTGIFQALRISVNNEYDHLNKFMETLPAMMAPRGISVFLCFQSLEVQIVKRWVRQYFSDCESDKPPVDLQRGLHCVVSGSYTAARAPL